MGRRRIDREKFGFVVDCGQHSSLDALAKLIDWVPIDRALGVISCSSKGEPAWPAMALFKAMLLSIWYDLSDVKLAEALDDRGSFRRFCGFSAQVPTPERTAFVHFRKTLVAHGLEKTLFDEITRQLKTKAIQVKTGTLDRTPKRTMGTLVMLQPVWIRTKRTKNLPQQPDVENQRFV